jgi:sugar phosphate isomerase/epimerase
VPKVKIAIDLAALAQPFKQALHTAAELGADAVEIHARDEFSPLQMSRTGVRQVRKMLDDTRLRVAAVALRSRRGYATLDGLDERIALTRVAMEMAQQLGAAVLVGTIGPIPSDKEPESRRMLLEVLTDLGRHGAQAGAMFAAETGAESGKTLAALLAELPEGTLGVALNPGKLLVHGFSAVEAAGELARWLTHVYVNDARQGATPSQAQYVPTGRGDADYPALLGALDDAAYRGYYSIQVPAVRDPATEAAETMGFLERL